MNRLLSFVALGLIACTVVAPSANAQYGSYGNVNGTQAQLQARINSGINSGRLTRSEANVLQNKLNRINQIEARMRMSGFRFSMSERNKLNAQLSSLSREITQQLFDSDNRWNNRRGNNRFDRNRGYFR